MSNQHFDVIVCGGGPSGITAAIASARSGCRTCLVERFGFLGGAATASLVVPVSGFFFNGRRVVDGIPWELIQRLQAENAALIEYPRGHISFDPEVYKLIAQRMVIESGVHLLTDSLITELNAQDRHILSIQIAGFTGTWTITSNYFIDATGEGVLCRKLGIQSCSKASQPLTLCFELSGVDCSTALLKTHIHHNGKQGQRSVCTELREFLKREHSNGTAPDFGGPWVNTLLHGDRLAVNMTRCTPAADDEDSITRAVCQMREDMFQLVELLRSHYAEFHNCSISYSAPLIGIREGCHLEGVHTVTENDWNADSVIPDPVAYAAHPIDIHHPYDDGQTLLELEQPGPISYRSLISPVYDNLLVTGRAISVNHSAHASTRVQGTCMALGQSAGTAAALCCQSGNSVHQLPYSLLRQHLPLYSSSESQ